MRRKDREIADRPEMEQVLRSSPVCRLAMADGNDPYVVPLCFGYRDGSFYVHSAPEGLKIDVLRKNPRCCVEVDATEGAIRNDNPCSWEMRYKSVICSGTAVFIEDPGEKARALNCILEHYGGNPQQVPDSSLQKVCVIRIDIDRMTGKKHGY